MTFDKIENCIEIKPVIDKSVRGLCAKPYPLHAI
jgi:hypothetical protein